VVSCFLEGSEREGNIWIVWFFTGLQSNSFNIFTIQVSKQFVFSGLWGDIITPRNSKFKQIQIPDIAGVLFVVLGERL